MVYIYEEIVESKPQWAFTSETNKFYFYLDAHHLIQFLMALLDEFEATHTSILSKKPLPSLDTDFKELIYEDTCRHTSDSSSADMVLTAPCSFSILSTCIFIFNSRK